MSPPRRFVAWPCSKETGRLQCPFHHAHMWFHRNPSSVRDRAGLVDVLELAQLCSASHDAGVLSQWVLSSELVARSLFVRGQPNEAAGQLHVGVSHASTPAWPVDLVL